jgi:hypothetical protein
MAHINVSLWDVSNLLQQNGYELNRGNIEGCLHEVFGFSRQRQGEFGVVEEGECTPEDVGKNRWYETLHCTHKTIGGSVVEGDLYIGYERKDEVWLKYGRPSEQILAEIRNDPSYNYEISQLSKRRVVS